MTRVQAASGGHPPANRLVAATGRSREASAATRPAAHEAQEQRTPARLATLIHAYRVDARAPQQIEQTAPYSVMPSPFPVLGFQFQGRLAVQQEGAAFALLSPAGITGLQRGPRWFQSIGPTRTVLVTLYPWSVPVLLGIPVRELAGRHVALADLLPPGTGRVLEERLAATPSPAGAIRLINDLLSTLAQSEREAPPPAVVHAAARMLRDPSGARVEHLVREIGLSRRQLERLFAMWFGLSPKQFAMLARFDLAMRTRENPPVWTEVAHQAGYADQAHFIREFRRYAGTTPSRFDSTPNEA